MTEMVERVSAAIARKRVEEYDGCFKPDFAAQGGECADGDCYCTRQCRVEARAAIAALREPTEEIRLAVNRAANIKPGDIWGAGAEGEWVWLNGIGAALGVSHVLEEAEEERSRERDFAEQHPDANISGTSAETKSGKRLRAMLDAALGED